MKNCVEMKIELGSIQISGTPKQIESIMRSLRRWKEEVRDAPEIEKTGNTIKLTGTGNMLYLTLYFLSGREFGISLIGD